MEIRRAIVVASILLCSIHKVVSKSMPPQGDHTFWDDADLSEGSGTLSPATRGFNISSTAHKDHDYFNPNKSHDDYISHDQNYEYYDEDEYGYYDDDEDYAVEGSATGEYYEDYDTPPLPQTTSTTTTTTTTTTTPKTTTSTTTTTPKTTTTTTQKSTTTTTTPASTTTTSTTSTTTPPTTTTVVLPPVSTSETKTTASDILEENGLAPKEGPPHYDEEDYSYYDEYEPYDHDEGSGNLDEEDYGLPGGYPDVHQRLPNEKEDPVHFDPRLPHIPVEKEDVIDLKPEVERGVPEVERKDKTPHREVDVRIIHTSEEEDIIITDSDMDTIQIVHTEEEPRSSIFTLPGMLAAIIGGSVVGLLCAILLVMFVVYRMRKRDEGSYPLDEPKRLPLTSPYATADKEIYA